MQLIVYGLLTDHLNRMLLQKITDDSLAPVGRAVDPGVLPAETLARAFREETGLIVMPVRMTSLYYSDRDNGRLQIYYRCTMRGGDLSVPDGGVAAGFFDSSPLPRGISAEHRRQIDGALHHAGGPPLLEGEAGGLGARLGRLLGRSEPTNVSAEWDVTVRLVEMGDGGEVAMAVVNEVGDGVGVGPGAAPWETAARLLGDGSAVRLVGVEIASERPVVGLLFASVDT